MSDFNTSYFFSLIRYSIGQQIEIPILSESDWCEVFELANKHCLTGVLFEGLERLHESQKPPINILFQWYAIKSQTINKNKTIDKRAAEATEIFKTLGYDSCVLKGQGVSLYYPKPELRIPGDIDIWVDGGWREILKALSKLGYKLGNAVFHHVDVCMFSDVSVEVHWIPSWVCNPIYNKRVQHYFKMMKSEQMNHSSGKGFNYPTNEFACVHSLLHIYRHLFIEGIGLRQLLDFNYILRSLNTTERLNVAEILHYFGLGKFLSSIMYIQQQVFGLDKDLMLCHANKCYGEFVLKEVMRAGNFGIYDERHAHGNNESKINRFIRTTKRLSSYVKYFPEEALYVPVWRIWRNLGRLLNLWL